MVEKWTPKIHGDHFNPLFGLNSLIRGELLLHVSISKAVEMINKHCGTCVPSLGKNAFQLSYKYHSAGLQLVY
jgi:hypothetical protein